MKFISEHHPILLAVTGAIGSILAFYFGTDIHLTESVFFLILTCIIVIFAYTRKAYLSFASTSKLPFPRGFWSLLFNKLPTLEGSVVSANPVKIVMVGDKTPKCQERISAIFKENNSPLLILETFVLDEDEESHVFQEKILDIKLKDAQGIILFQTRELEKEKWVYENVDTWAEKNSQIPCFAVKLLSESEKEKIVKEGNEPNPIPEKYNSIPESNLSAISWRFLNRGNERSLLWKKQASINRKYAFSFIALFGISCFGIWNLHDSYICEKEEKTAQLLLMARKAVLPLFKREEVSNLDRQLAFDNFVTLSLDCFAIENNLEDMRSQLGLAFFRHCENPDSIYQIGKADAEREDIPYGFNFDRKSIVGCAFQNPNHFVFWQREMKEKEEAILSASTNKIIGHWNASQKVIEGIDSNSDKFECSYKDYDHNSHNGIVCLNYRSPDRKGECGVCLDTKSTATNFLREEKTLIFLKNLARELSIIPVDFPQKILLDSTNFSSVNLQVVR